MADENDIVEYFSKYGVVNSTVIVKDKFTCEPRGEGFVEMPDEKQAAAAISALKGAEFMGCPLVLKPAHRQALYGKMHVDGRVGRAWHNKGNTEARLKGRR